MPDCQYLIRKAARGSPVAPSYADEARSYLTRHILPQFGLEHIDGITPPSIDAWALGLKDQLSPAAANRCLAVLRVMLREAERQGLIASNPAAEVQQLRETPRERGTLTLEEARLLFDENKFAEHWESEVAFTANLIAATTGMRLGEVQALRIQDVRGGYVVVEHSFDRKHGLKTTKTRQVREIPITRKSARWLARLTMGRTEGFLFSTTNGKTPVYYKQITAGLYMAFRKMGITEDQRKLRNLSFHGWRHFYNSLLCGRISDAKLQRLTGHRTQQMTERYTHFRVDDFRDVLTIQETLAI